MVWSVNLSSQVPKEYNADHMRRHRDDPQEPTLNAGENFARARRSANSNWMAWLGALYTFAVLLLVFLARPIGSLLGLPPTLEFVVLELAVWMVPPLVAVWAVYRYLQSGE